MKKPEMKVVRFDAEDVIATSSLVNRSYVTKGADVNQYIGSVTKDADAFYSFFATDGVAPTNAGSYSTAADENAYPFAWYNYHGGISGNSSYWSTDNAPANSYGSLPTGDD